VNSLGFRRLASWRLVVLIALAAAALRIVLGYLVIDPLTARFRPPAVSPQGIDEITGLTHAGCNCGCVVARGKLKAIAIAPAARPNDAKNSKE
jgi:hypothetical protein